MKLLCDGFRIIIDEVTGNPIEITSLNDEYQMNWIRGDYSWGKVNGFETINIEKTEKGVLISAINNTEKVKLTINRYVKNEKYCEEYIFENISNSEVTVSEENLGIVFPYNCLFDKKENMIHTRCNSHIWCAEDICNIHSVKLDGKKPYFIQKAIAGSFSGYGLLCDINASPNASWDRGNIVLYPKKNILQKDEKLTFAFEFYFSDSRENISPVSADKYSGFIDDEFEVVVDWNKKIEDITALVDDKPITFTTDGNKAVAKLKFDTLGEKK